VLLARRCRSKAALPALGSGRALPALAPAVLRGGRFTGCQSWGQRSAGVRKSISARSLSTSFNLMKPLFVKAAALLAIPLKLSKGTATGSERTGRSPLPFRNCHSTGPKNKYATHRNMTRGCRCCRAVLPGPGEAKSGCKGTLPGSAVLRDVAASLGRKVTGDGQKLGDAEKLAAELKQSYRKASLGGCRSLLSVRKGLGGGTWCVVRDYFPKDSFWRKQGLIPRCILALYPHPSAHLPPRCSFSCLPRDIVPRLCGCWHWGVPSGDRRDRDIFPGCSTNLGPSPGGLFWCP